jgi:Domain of unknown function (DUF4304)
MTSTPEFKRQVSKLFGAEMRKLGFKGTGFTYNKETENFLVAVHLEGNRWGGSSCSACFAVHPKSIRKNSRGDLDLKKLPHHRYEFKMGLWDYARGEAWEYSNLEEENLQIIQEIVARIKAKAIPVIELYCATPGLLDTFEISDMADFHDNYVKKTGTSIATTDTRFAWAMAMIFEHTNLPKAKLFAEYCLSASDAPRENTFFGQPDLERISKA